MNVVVVYASKYGSTRGIAEFIANELQQQGLPAEARSVGDVADPGGYDAFVIGSAVYMEHWLSEAVEFVRRNRALLATRPVWLFSSGPLDIGKGTISRDDPALEPKEIAEIREAIHPRDHAVFFGALDPGRLGFMHRTLRKLPAARAVLPEGDFRDWSDIEAWAAGIARELGASDR